MAIWPLWTTGRSIALLMPRIATSGWLMIGVAARPPIGPRLVTVNVEPASSFARDRLVAGGLGDAAHLAGRLPEVHRLGMAHDRHAQAAIGLRGDAQVDRFVARDHFALVFVMGVELREAAERPRHRQHDERQVGELGLAVGAMAVEMLAERFELGDVDFFDVREVGNLRVADDHFLGDPPPQADHLDLGRVRAGRATRCGRRGSELGPQKHVDVAVRDPAVRAGAGDVLQIDVHLAGATAHGRTGQRRQFHGRGNGGGTHRTLHHRHGHRFLRRGLRDNDSPLPAVSPIIRDAARRSIVGDDVEAHQLGSRRPPSGRRCRAS